MLQQVQRAQSPRGEQQSKRSCAPRPCLRVSFTCRVRPSSGRALSGRCKLLSGSAPCISHALDQGGNQSHSPRHDFSLCVCRQTAVSSMRAASATPHRRPSAGQRAQLPAPRQVRTAQPVCRSCSGRAPCWTVRVEQSVPLWATPVTQQTAANQRACRPCSAQPSFAEGGTRRGCSSCSRCRPIFSTPCNNINPAAGCQCVLCSQMSCAAVVRAAAPWLHRCTVLLLTILHSTLHSARCTPLLELQPRCR